MPSKKVQVGDFIVWSLSDGYLNVDQRCFAGIKPNILRKTLALGHVEWVSDLVVRMQVNGFLIKTDAQPPGHMAFLFCSNNKEMLLWGDIVHTAGIQFKKPEWYLIVDVDGKQGVVSRKRLFATAADKQLLIGGAHLPECGLGYASRKEEVFAWEPLEN